MNHPENEDAVPVTGDTNLVPMRGKEWSRAQLELLKRTVCKGASDDEFNLFVEVCKRTQLDPFARQIFMIRRGGIMQPMVSIDGARLTAQRSGEYEGQVGPFWCGEDGEWRDAWLEKSPPVAAKVGVWRRGFKQPTWGVGRHAAYVVPSNPVWSKMPDSQLAKCCEMLALRKAFPQELSGLYTNEEMEQAGGAPVIDLTGAVEDVSQENPATEEMVMEDGEIVEMAPPPQHAKWLAAMKQSREILGDIYFDILREFGYKTARDVKDTATRKAIHVRMMSAADEAISAAEKE